MTMISARPRGRPAGASGPIKPPCQSVVVRVREPMNSRLDEWIAHQLDRPTRPEAMRRLTAQALARFDEETL